MDTKFIWVTVLTKSRGASGASWSRQSKQQLINLAHVRQLEPKLYDIIVYGVGGWERLEWHNGYAIYFVGVTDPVHTILDHETVETQFGHAPPT